MGTLSLHKRKRKEKGYPVLTSPYCRLTDSETPNTPTTTGLSSSTSPQHPPAPSAS